MRLARVFASRLRGLLLRKRLDRDLDEEIRFHLDMQRDDHEKEGMEADDARYAALRDFGAVEPIKETYRESQSFAVVEAIFKDVQYALRTLRKDAGFTATSVISLALAIGASTAMFSLLNAVLFQPLPYQAPEQLAMLWTDRPTQNLREGRSSYWNFEQWKRQSRSFADMAAFDGSSTTLLTSDKAERIAVVRTSPNFFHLLGVAPLHGRLFTAGEAGQRQHLVLISYRFWQLRLGGAPNAIGATLNLDGFTSQIIGILPADFEFPQVSADIWESYTLSPDWQTQQSVRGRGSWYVIGRLRPGITFEHAQAEMSAIAQRLNEELPAPEQNVGLSLVPLSTQFTGPKARLALWLLAAAVLCVLLIATTNVASLSLARSAGREREIATRVALGAGRGRIVRQLLAESLTLTVASGLLGFAVAMVGTHLIVIFEPVNSIYLDKIGLDPCVLGVAVAICLITGILVGLAPAITMARRNLRLTGHEGARGTAGGAGMRRIRRILVVTEFALAIVLLTGAGLLFRSLWSVGNVDPGFESERVLSLQLSIPASIPIAQRPNFYNRVLDQVKSLAGVESIGIIENFFISESPEQPVATEANAGAIEALRFRSDGVSNGFFRALKTPLLKGRFFSSEDTPASSRVAILNEVMARRLWPGDYPIGKRLRLGDGASGAWFTVVGVVGDMRRLGLEKESTPQMFTPLAQDPSRFATLLVRTSVRDPLTWAGAIQAAVHRVQKYAPVYGIATLEHLLSKLVARRRLQTVLVIGFAVVALFMAALGIYGLIQYSVSTRTQEIGIRMALGAQAGEIFRMMLREGLQLSLTGLAIGLAAAIWLDRSASSLLFGVSANDPLTFTVVSALLTAIAAAACYFPARRAMRVQPVVALRQD